jgi:hypothetical protein
VVDHDTVTEPCSTFGNTIADFDHNATGLVTGNRMLLPGFPISVGAQVSAAHAGGLDLQNGFVRSRCRVRKFPQLDLAIPQKNDADHS